MAVASRAPGEILPTVPSIPSAGRPTRGTSSRSSTRVVKTPQIKVRAAAKAPKVRVKTPKMPKDAMALMVPKAKRIKNGKAFEFSTKRKPVI